MKALLLTLLVSLSAFAEESALLKYDYVGIAAGKTTYSNGSPNLDQYGVGFQKLLNQNIFIGASYYSGRQNYAAFYVNFNEYDFDLGSRFTVNDKMDAILDITLGSIDATANPGSKITGSGQSIYLGIRSSINPNVEVELGAISTSATVNSTTETSSHLKLGAAYNVNPQFQIAAGISLGDPQTQFLGLKMFY